MITHPVTVTLQGREYPMSWGNMAKFRFASIPAAERALGGPSFLTQLVWAAYAGGVTHRYPTWEHLAPVVADLSKDQYDALDEAMANALPPPAEDAKDTPAAPAQPEPTTAEKKSDSTQSGPSPDAASG